MEPIRPEATALIITADAMGAVGSTQLRSADRKAMSMLRGFIGGGKSRRDCGRRVPLVGSSRLPYDLTKRTDILWPRRKTNTNFAETMTRERGGPLP